MVLAKLLKETHALCAKFDDNVKNRIKYYDCLFHKLSSNLPSLREVRKSISYSRLLLHFKEFQRNPACADSKKLLMK